MQEAILVLKDMYFDSVMLMAAAARVKAEHGLDEAAFFMANPANRKLLAGAGFSPPEEAGPGDVALAVRAADAAGAEKALAMARELLLAKKPAPSASGAGPVRPRGLLGAFRESDAGLAVVSIPGQYVEAQAGLALSDGRHVFIFSDNVPLDAEIRLKKKAAAHGVLCMGPDCGTGWLDGYGVGFSNAAPRGRVGLVSASGTGLQAVACHLADLGEGVAQGIGVGGRDLSREVGGLMTLAALDLLNRDPATELVIVISKPPAPEVMARLREAAAGMNKPVVLCCQGAAGAPHPNLTWTATLAGAARAAADRLAGRPAATGDFDDPDLVRRLAAEHARPGGLLFGAYTGGTLAHEAETLLAPLLPDLAYGEESALAEGRPAILDFGDDQYTQGRPHPMIDPSSRSENMLRLAAGGKAGVVLFDLVLGRCSHPDPAGEFAKVMKRLEAASGGKKPVFVGAVAGLDGDVQNRSRQIETLRRAGALILPDNAQAVRLAALLTKPELAASFDWSARPAVRPAAAVPGGESRLFGPALAAVNLGVDMFADSLAEQGMRVAGVDWRPPVSREVEEALLCLPGLRD